MNSLEVAYSCLSFVGGPCWLRRMLGSASLPRLSGWHPSIWRECALGHDRAHAVQQTRSPEVPGGATMQDDQLSQPSFMVVPHYDALPGGLRRSPVAETDPRAGTAVELSLVEALRRRLGGLRRSPVAETDPLAGAAVAPGVVNALRRRKGGGQPLPMSWPAAGADISVRISRHCACTLIPRPAVSRSHCRPPRSLTGTTSTSPRAPIRPVPTAGGGLSPTR